MSEALPDALASLLTWALAFLPRLLAALVIFGATLLVAAWVSRLLRRAFLRRRADSHGAQAIAQILRWTLVVFGTLAALQQVNFNVTAFLAGLGIVGFTIGFALQDISKNLMAGLLLLVQRPFEIGEVIAVKDQTGAVQAVSLRATEIRTLDGRMVLIPNADVYASAITNLSRYPLRRIEVALRLDPAADLDDASRLAIASVAALPGTLAEPAPDVAILGFGVNVAELTLYYWVDTRATDLVAARNRGIVAVQQAYAGAGLDLPYPVPTARGPR